MLWSAGNERPMSEIDADFLMKGLILGVSIAAPVGPIGILCIRRTLSHGMAAGIAGGLGTALADGLYAALAAFGFATLLGDLLADNPWFRLGGAAFLLWLGWKGWHAEPAARAAAIDARTLAGTFAATFLLTVANPATIVTFVGLFLALGLADAGDSRIAGMSLVAGVVLGSFAWWIVLSGIVASLRDRIGPSAFRAVNRAASLLLVGFALWMLAEFFGRSV
jgi:putative LysE/RhtB family amino acid efflux pump